MSNVNTSNKIFTTINVKESELKNINPQAETLDIESQTKSNLDEKISDNVTYCAIISTLVIVLLIFILPFIICDLYFSYNSISCQYNSTPIGFDLSTWLQVTGFSALGYVITSVIFVIISQKYESVNIIVKLLKFLFTLFYFSWLIVGSVMFWKYLEPLGTCNSDVSNYMWVRLIIGLIGVLSTSKSSDKK